MVGFESGKKCSKRSGPVVGSGVSWFNNLSKVPNLLGRNLGFKGLNFLLELELGGGLRGVGNGGSGGYFDLHGMYRYCAGRTRRTLNKSYQCVTFWSRLQGSRVSGFLLRQLYGMYVLCKSVICHSRCAWAWEREQVKR